MKRLTPAFLAAITIGSKASRLIEVDSFSSSSKLASLEMQARWMTASMPSNAAASFAVSRMSPSTSLQVRVALRQEVVAEVHDVVDGDLVARVEQLRDEQAADIAGAAGDQHVLE